MNINIPKILENSEKRLSRKEPGAVATGIGVFMILSNKTPEGYKILLRTRTEKGSLTGQNLSGMKELPGGAVDMQDFGVDYDSAPLDAAARELLEETGLILNKEMVLNEGPYPLYPAWTIINGEIVDLANALMVPMAYVEETDRYRELLANGNLEFVSIENLGEVTFVSKRMKFLAELFFRKLVKN